MPGKILIVDDEKDIVLILQERLLMAGYEVVTASDGVSGLKAAKESKPDLIVLDLMLPKMDGYTVCNLLKKDIEYSKIPIIMLTARAGEADRVKGLQSGADLFITKPFDQKSLLDKIAELIKGAVK